MIKNAALWLRTSGLDLDTTKWSTLKYEIRAYFRPADFRRRARDELANLKQTGRVTNYIDNFKRVCSKISNITDEEMLDRFVIGLSASI